MAACSSSANDLVHGRELWQSNGTAAGTALVADINPGSAGSYPSSLTNINGTLFFSANDGVHGAEPWILGPVPINPAAVTGMIVPAFMDPGLVANAAGNLAASTEGDAGGSGVDAGSSGSPEHLLLINSQPAATNESARRSPAVLGRKSQPDLLGEVWSEDMVSDWLSRSN